MNFKNLSEDLLRKQLLRCHVDYLRSYVLSTCMKTMTVPKAKNYLVAQIVVISIEEKERLIDMILKANNDTNKMLEDGLI